jgi:excisionase family DNA binding protein
MNFSKVNSTTLIFENQLVDRKRLAEHLSLAPSTISRMMAEEGLPHYKIGKSCRFKISEVMAFLQERKRP